MLDLPANEEPYRIYIHHIGGIGNYGHARTLSVLRDVEWIIYDALEESLSSARLPGARYRMVPKCIAGNNASRVRFYVTEAGSASSLLRPAESAASYTMVIPDGRIQVWGLHTKIVKTLELDTHTLDSLVERGEVPPVDFLSVDAQGAELSILNGASKMLSTRTTAVICEVEFSRLYEDQPLFPDVQYRLRKDGFRPCELYNRQYMNVQPYPAQIGGKGFLTAAEALFMKEPNSVLGGEGMPESDASVSRIIQSLKLAAIAVVFDQLDYSLYLCQRLEESTLISLDSLANRTNIRYIRLLRDLVHATDRMREAHSAILERREEEPEEIRPKVAIVLELLSVLVRIFFQLGVRRVLNNILRRRSGSSYGGIAGVLYDYGFKELAVRQTMREANIPYWSRGLGNGFLEFLISFIAIIS